MNEIYKIADVFFFPSFQEGLSVALLDAMASGLPIVCSNIRGNSDLVQNELGGYLCNPTDFIKFADCLDILLNKNNEKIKYYKKCIFKGSWRCIFLTLGRWYGTLMKEYRLMLN